MITNSGDPVLIDFSLSKYIADAGIDAVRESKSADSHSISRLHTGDSGSPTYMAPEVYRKEAYCEKCDMYSTGVVLLEIILGENLPVDKDKAAFKYVQDMKEKLPKRPFPDVVRKLLDSDPSTRASAREALSLNVFTKNGLEVKFSVHYISSCIIRAFASRARTQYYCTESMNSLNTGTTRTFDRSSQCRHWESNS